MTMKSGRARRDAEAAVPGPRPTVSGLAARVQAGKITALFRDSDAPTDFVLIARSNTRVPHIHVQPRAQENWRVV